MISVTPLKIGHKEALGLKVDLPNSPPLLVILGRTGFIMCGFLKMEAAEKVNTAAAMVSGVETFDDVLKAEIRAVTSKAEMTGIEIGMKGEDAVKLFV